MSAHHACTCIQCCNARTVPRSADPQPEKVIYDLNCRVAELKRAILRAMQSAEDAGILGAEAFGILQGVVHDGIPAPPQPAPEQCFAEGYAWGFGDGILGGGRRDFDALRGWLDRQRRESPTPVEDCPACDGEKTEGGGPCFTCGGTGKAAREASPARVFTRVMESITYTIEAADGVVIASCRNIGDADRICALLNKSAADSVGVETKGEK